MTKRKASVALDSDNSNQINTHNKGTTRGNSNTNSSSNPGTQRADNSVLIPHNGTAPGSSSSSSIGIANQCQQETINHNQNDNSVESNSSANGVQHKGKKERADNWSSAEIQILHKGIESRRDIFYGPPSQATKKNRELAWEAIAREVNAVSTTPRSLSQVMKKYKNEKCRAKRKFTDPDKDEGSSSTTNNSAANDAASTINLSAQNQLVPINQQQQQQQQQQPQPQPLMQQQQQQTQSQQPQQQQSQHQHQQSHQMTSVDSMTGAQTSMNVVKLAPQNVAKTMIDLPGHMQQIQVPNDDNMVLIVPPEMDGLLSGVNIVSDGNGHHHFQKCPGNNALSNHQHNHQHNQNPIQAINTGQTLVNGTMSSGMMTRAIPASSMCSLVYSTGNEICPPDHHGTQNLVGHATLSTNHLGLGTQSLAHHRGTIVEQSNQGHQSSHHQHLHHPHQPQHQQHPQQQHHSHQQPQHQTHQNLLANSHSNQNVPQNHLATTSITTNTSGGVAVESQLKNLLFNLLLKDGQHPNSISLINGSSNQDNKHRNDMLAIIASSLTKIEGHLSKISKVACNMMAQNMTLNLDDSDVASSNQLHSSAASSGGGLNITGSDGNNNTMSATDSNITSDRRETGR